MKVSIVSWEPEHQIVRITGDKMDTLSITKTIANEVALIWPRASDRLDRSEAEVVADALTLAAKIAGYLDELGPNEAYDAIAGMLTTPYPYDGWRPMPRAGRTEN